MHLGCDIWKHETKVIKTGKRLYSVSGRYIKPALTLPFLTSLQDALDWINRADKMELDMRPSDTEPNVP